jgi:hypothetical protein
MLTKNQAEDILLTLRRLPTDKVVEVQDFIRFLTERYAHTTPVDDSDAWSEEDLRDLTAAALERADQSVASLAMTSADERAILGQ